MICENCGKDNIKGAVFCSYCGQKVSSDLRRQSRRAAPPDESDAPGRDAAVSGSGRKRPIPDRTSPAPARSVSTLIPRRARRQDMFFDDIDSPDEDAFYEERDLRSRRRSIIAGIVLLGVMIYIFWLLVLPGGQDYRASLGWGAPAAAYSRLGKRAVDSGDANLAAKYYYDALRLEPDNYAYAFDVATSQELLGDYDKALSAYAKCISLNPDAVEPYMNVSDIYTKKGDKDRAVNALMTGFNRTGDLTLFRAYQRLNANSGGAIQ